MIWGGTRKRSWSKHYTASRKVAGSSPDGIVEISQFTQTFRPHCGPEIYSASNRNEYQNQKNNVSGE
jgi:hypothetical protein